MTQLVPDLIAGRTSEVGGLAVRRALPTRGRRTVGAWCFVDHFGPVGPELADAMQVGPHPHIGLQTVTWLLEGELLHTDSLGSEQLVRPGQLNLMTAGRGIAHAESARRDPRGAHGAQLWIALPDASRHGPPAFEHHEALPGVALGDAAATVLVGTLAGTTSPATVHTPIVGAQVEVLGGSVVAPLEPAWEHAVVVLEGRVELGAVAIEPGALGYLAAGRSELACTAAPGTRFLLLGGEPFESVPLIWWNFVARTRDEVARAREDWQSGHERFGTVASHLARIDAPEVPPGLKTPG